MATLKGGKEGNIQKKYVVKICKVTVIGYMCQMSFFHFSTVLHDDLATIFKMPYLSMFWKSLKKWLDLHVDLPTILMDFQAHLHFYCLSPSASVHGSYTQGQESLLAQVKGSLNHTRGLQLSVSGDLRHNMAFLGVLPPTLGLDALLGQSETITEGRACKNCNFTSLITFVW